MIITCPSCDTRYAVDAAGFLPSGRKVRCAKCGYSWHQEAPDAEEAEAREADAAHDAPPPPPPPPPGKKKTAEKPASSGDEDRPARRAPMRARGSRALQAAGWMLLAAFVAGTAVGAATYKAEIVKFWPATRTLYSAFNDPVGMEHMAFKNIAYEYEFEDGLPVLSIRGEIVNEGAERFALRPVQVDLRGENRERLYHWTFRLPETALNPDERVEFATRVSSPPLEARDLVISFVEDGQGSSAGGGGEEP